MYIRVEEVPEKVPETVPTARRCVVFACQKSVLSLASPHMDQSTPAESQTEALQLPASFREPTLLHTHILTGLECLTPQHKGIEFKLGGHWLPHTQRWTLMCLWGVAGWGLFRSGQPDPARRRVYVVECVFSFLICSLEV